MRIIGINVRINREEKKITLRELSKKAGVTASMLSQIETGKVSPSLLTLKKIADVLGTTIGALLGEKDEISRSPVSRVDERGALTSVGNGIKVSLLTAKDCNKQLEPLIFRLDPNASSGKSSYKHFGQEFVFITKGAMEITLSDKKYVLQKGDTIYFNSNIPHRFKNVYAGITEVLWVVTPPTF
ncbi:MAG: XRE family transcriptional regulator [Candidatus Omnitrophota bacterium]